MRHGVPTSAQEIHRYNACRGQSSEAQNKLSRREALNEVTDVGVTSGRPDMSHLAAAAAEGAAGPERRNAFDRRRRTLYSLLYGSFHPRRRGPRRTGRPSIRDLDWHQPQWLAIAMLILVLSCVDAGLTLTLISHGAYEVNPFMAPLVGGSALIFTLVKVGLTAGGVVMLTLLARIRAFGRIPVSFVLYALLAGYAGLVVYEFRLLEQILFTV